MHDHERFRQQAERLRRTARNPKIPEDGPMGRRELLRQAAIFEAEAHAAFTEWNAQQRAQAAAAARAEEERIKARVAETNRRVQEDLDRQAQALERHLDDQRRRDDRR